MTGGSNYGLEPLQLSGISILDFVIRQLLSNICYNYYFLTDYIQLLPAIEATGEYEKGR